VSNQVHCCLCFASPSATEHAGHTSIYIYEQSSHSFRSHTVTDARAHTHIRTHLQAGYAAITLHGKNQTRSLTSLVLHSPTAIRLRHYAIPKLYRGTATATTTHMHSHTYHIRRHTNPTLRKHRQRENTETHSVERERTYVQWRRQAPWPASSRAMSCGY